MPKGELFIKDVNGNWQDSYEAWGLSMSDTSLSALMTPAPNKDYIKNRSRLESGERCIVNAKKDSRSLNLSIHIKAKTKEDFFNKYNEFCKVLGSGNVWIKTKYQDGVVYKCIYINCPQFSQFMQGMGFFTLKLEEPNPDDRVE